MLALYEVLLVGDSIVIMGFPGGKMKFAFAKRLSCVPAIAENNSANASVSANVFLFMKNTKSFPVNTWRFAGKSVLV